MAKTFAAVGTGGATMTLASPKAATHAETRLAEQLQRGEILVEGAGPFADRAAAVAWLRDQGEADQAAVTPAVAGASTGVPDGNVDQVLTWVRGAPSGEDPTEGWEARAQAAIDAEVTSGDARKGIVDPLTDALAAEDQD